MNNNESKKYEEIIKKNQKQMEERRKELRKIIFDEDEQTKEEKSPRKRKKPIFTNLLLSLMLVGALTFSIFLILDSANRVNELYEIINAIFILLIVINIIISFPKTFYKNKTSATITTSLLIIITMTFNVLYLFNIIKLPLQSHIIDYKNKSLTDALEYTEKNNIESEEIFEYSDVIDKYKIISQNIKPNTLTKNIKDVEFTVSNGPDYNKEVILPDMTGYKTDDILKFTEENHLNNVQITFEENEEKNDIIINQSTTGNIKRSDSIIFTASLGDISSLSPIKLKDLKNKKLLNAETYLGKNGIIYELKFEFSNTIKKGHIIKTNPSKGNEVKPNDKVILTVSKGKEIKVPELKNKSLKEVTKWIIENNLQIEYADEYSDNIQKGKAISSSYKKGDVIEEETKVRVVFSKGALKLPKFEDLTAFKTWADKYNIKYEVKEEFNSDIPKDKIIKFSIKQGQKIKTDETITVYVSKGESVTIPDFIGKTKTEIQKECNSLGITCTFYNTLSDKTEGTAISQNISKDTEVSKGDNIEIEIATKKQSEVTTKKSSNTSNNNSNNSSNKTTNKTNSENTSNNSNNNSNSQNNCTNIQYHAVAGNNGQQTVSMTNRANSSISINWIAESSCSNGSTTSGSICYARNITKGKNIAEEETISSCDKLEIHYIK